MGRLDRIVFGGLGIGLVAAALSGLRQETRAAGRASSPTTIEGGPQRTSVRAVETGKATAPSSGEDLAAFVRELGRLREGDAAALPALRELAERLCIAHSRCDARGVLAHYEGLSVADRVRGVERERRYQELRNEVDDARRRGLGEAEWTPLQSRIIDDLQALATQSLSEPDFVPGARALSLSARLMTDRIELDSALDEDQREELLVDAGKDARAAMAAFARAGMLTPELEATWVLARLERLHGNIASARDRYESCLALARRVSQPAWEENALRGIIDLADEAGDVAEKARLLNELALLRTPAESWFLAEKQGEALLERDEARSAAAFLETCPPSDPHDRRQWHLLLGSAYLRSGEIDRAREEYAAERTLPWDLDVVLAMASIDLKTGRADRVATQVGGLVATPGLPLRRQAQALQLVGEAQIQLARLDEAASALSSALELGGSWQARLTPQRATRDGTTSVLGERIGLHALALYAQARVGLGDGLEAARAIESWQLRSLRTVADAEIDTAHVQAWARTFDLGLVTWVVGSDSSVVSHVAPDGSALGATIPHGRRAIESAVRRVTEATIAGDLAATVRLMGEVRGVILPPLIAARIASLEGPGRRRILFLLHGPLERLPVELLELDERVIAVTLPGLPEREPGAPIHAGDLSRWWVVGEPVDAGGRSLLPGAREELSAIAALLRSSPDLDRSQAGVLASDDAGPGFRLGSRFDRSALSAAFAGRRPLHVATHLIHGCGAADGRLADVGLQLSGGDVFCAREIRAAQPRLPLAVLSACETAEGRFVDAEGLQGIARAFLESGTRNLVVTLWPVEDRAARDFSVELHRALLAGARPSEAGAAARATLRAKGYGVADWAAFRVLGRD